MVKRRALHWVFKIRDRGGISAVLCEKLGMRVLRHEEFQEGCQATCNGPYSGMWSKTMIGYGDESSHFVLQLTYNYSVKEYNQGNDFKALILHSPPHFTTKEMLYQGYRFEFEVREESKEFGIAGVVLGSSDLEATVAFWVGVLGVGMIKRTEGQVVLGAGQDQAFIKFVRQQKVQHGAAFGRIAFAVDTHDLLQVQQQSLKKGYKVQNPLVVLKTQGKADVSVVIFLDPDGYQICFVGAEGFQELSKVDPLGKEKLLSAMELDKSGPHKK